MAAAKAQEANAQLSMEKIASERIDQQVKLNGIRLDEESLKIKRAELVAGIQKDVADGLKSTLKNRPGYNERGMKSNNVE